MIASVETLLGQPGAPAALLDWLYPISRHQLLQICEDATATPVLLQEGNPLWVGRARRTASKRLRKALAVRDRGCTTTGCDRPPSWSQAHHQRAWSQGGTTDLSNLTSHCSRDHRDADAGYRMVRLPDGPWPGCDRTARSSSAPPSTTPAAAAPEPGSGRADAGPPVRCASVPLQAV